MPATPRNLGLGFGERNQFTISLSEPNRAMMNELPVPNKVMDDLRKALQERIKAATDAKEAKRSIGKILFVEDILIPVLKKHSYAEGAIHNIIPIALALFIPDVLVDMNVSRLTKHAIPELMKNKEFKALITNGLNKFFKYNADGNIEFYIGEHGTKSYARPAEIKEEEESQVSLRFLRSIIVSKFMKENPELVPKEDIERWKNKIFEEPLAYLYNELTGTNPSGIDLTKINPKINLTDNQVYAYLIPAILDRMDTEALKKAASLVVPHLDIRDFKPIALEKYFQPKIKMAEETVSLSNENRRSLQFFAKPNKGGSDTSTLELRDKIYKFQHTHIHFERDGEEKEYQLKDKDGSLIKFDGEVHNVFEYIPSKEEKQSTPRKRLVALGSPLQIIDTPNQFIKELLDDVKKIDQEKRSLDSNLPENYFLHLQNKIDFGKVFMNSINTQNENELIYHSWASLRSGTHGFQSGLRFIISTQPIKVSQDQYDSLKELFGKMRTNLQEDEILDPIDRKAGWRKEKGTLITELRNLTSATPNPRMK